MGEVTVVIFRSVMAFVSLLIFSRLLGKTQISQMSFFEYVSGITLGSIAAELSIDLTVRPWPIYVGLGTWTVLTLATQFTALKSRWMAKMLDGEPVVVVQNGQVLERNLGMLRLRQGELAALLRSKGVFDYSAVEFAIMEPQGELSVLQRSQDLPVTPADLNIPTQYKGMGIELVVDGQVMEQNLKRLHVNKAWLTEKLREQGLNTPSEAFLAVLDTQGKIYIDRYTDRVPPTDDLSDYPGPN